MDGRLIFTPKKIQDEKWDENISNRHYPSLPQKFEKKKASILNKILILLKRLKYSNPRILAKNKVKITFRVLQILRYILFKFLLIIFCTMTVMSQVFVTGIKNVFSFNFPLISQSSFECHQFEIRIIILTLILLFEYIELQNFVVLFLKLSLFYICRH